MNILITESQYKLITETRHGLLNYLVRKGKEYTGVDWPEYVIRDWMYKNTKEIGDGDNETYKKLGQHYFDNWIQRFGRGYWEFRVLDVSIDIFIDGDQQSLKSKIGGSINQQVPNDSERHNLQQFKLDTKGVSPEPIIVYLTKDGKYDLVEGWHRTTASLKKYDRYKQNAWVYINF